MFCISEIDTELLLQIKLLSEAKATPIYKVAAQLLRDGLWVEALRQERQQAQPFAKKLGLERAERLEQLAGGAKRLELEELIEELRHCPSLEEKKAKFAEAAKRMDMSEAELILALRERVRKVRTWALLKRLRKW